MREVADKETKCTLHPGLTSKDIPRREHHGLAEVVKKLLLSHSEILNTHPPTQDREMNREIELHYAERNRSGLIDRSWCGDRDSDVEQSQRTPSLHYTGYIVQTVCQLSVGRALPPNERCDLQHGPSPRGGRG